MYNLTYRTYSTMQSTDKKMLNIFEQNVCRTKIHIITSDVTNRTKL